MFPDLILLIIALLALIFASIFDLKIREVPDWLNYSLIFSAFAIRLLASIIYNYPIYFIYGIIGFIITFILGTIFYYTRQWGGGDTKLLMGLGIVFASKPYFTPFSNIPFILILLINILVVGAFYGLIWSIILMIKNWQRFRIRFKVRIKNEKVKFWEKIIAAIIILNIILMFLLKDNFFRLMLIILNILLLVYFYLWIAIRSIESLSMFKTIPTEKLREGDWVAKNIYIKKQLIYKTNSGISNQDIQTLKEKRVRKVMIKEGIPFVPPFLIGVILSIITGKILFLF